MLPIALLFQKLDDNDDSRIGVADDVTNSLNVRLFPVTVGVKMLSEDAIDFNELSDDSGINDVIAGVCCRTDVVHRACDDADGSSLDIKPLEDVNEELLKDNDRESDEADDDIDDHDDTTRDMVDPLTLAEVLEETLLPETGGEEVGCESDTVLNSGDVG